MPYVKQEPNRRIAKEQGLEQFRDWLRTLPVEQLKGDLAFAVKYLGLTAYGYNYFGLSTGTDAVRSALRELELDLANYEAEKKSENGDTL